MPSLARLSRAVLMMLLLANSPVNACVGDCDGDGQVLVDELVRGVTVALGGADLEECGAFDRNFDAAITVDELLVAVTAALSGCPAAAQRAFVITSDFETGSYGTIRTADRSIELAAGPSRSVNADAVARMHDDRLYIVNRFGLLGDSIQALDPQAGFAKRWDCSTGAGSNPHDFLAVSATKAYVALYEKKELLIIDPSVDASCRGFVRGTVDLAEYADADGFPEPESLALANGVLYVALQRLNRDDLFTPAGNGRIVAIDIATDRVVDVIELRGGNPFTRMEIREDRLWVATVGYFAEDDGGIEVVDLRRGESLGFLVEEADLGGDVTDFVLASGRRGYAVLSGRNFRNSLVAFDPSTKEVGETLIGDSGFISQLRPNERGELWVADRNVRRPGVRVFGLHDGVERTTQPIDLGLPPFDMTFLR